MLALSPQRIRDDEGETGEDEFPVGSTDHRQFVDFGDIGLLDCIDFDYLFAEIEGDGTLLPGLEMVDHDITTEFSASSGGEESEMNVSEVPDGAGNGGLANDEEEDGDKSASGRDESGTVDPIASNPAGQGGGGRKKSSSVQSKSNPPQGKRKTKVDWTPDLHRRFVQAVEQLGLDKAVPSKILEIMGTECLTRHNIASHLQKYRSHRKHQLAREAENHQRRQMYSGGKTELSPWLINGPAMGFPPPVAAARPGQPPLRPLHVWGHPSAGQSAWPQHAVHPLPPAPPPRLPWSPFGLGPPYSLPPLLGPPLDPTSYWHPHHHHQGLMPGLPFPGIPSSAMYKVDACIGVPTDRSGPQPPPHSHPSKETIDAAIGDALTKPWQPLPLGLKPPSLDGVLTELHRQGIRSIPPS